MNNSIKLSLAAIIAAASISTSANAGSIMSYDMNSGTNGVVISAPDADTIISNMGDDSGMGRIIVRDGYYDPSAENDYVVEKSEDAVRNTLPDNNVADSAVGASIMGAGAAVLGGDSAVTGAMEGTYGASSAVDGLRAGGLLP